VPQKSGRALKKSQTRAALIRAATELFTELGYADTTMIGVADRANLHVQTLYKHFPNKEALAVAPQRDQLEQFKTALQNRDRTQRFSSFWRDWATASANHTQSRYRDEYLASQQSISGNPEVVGNQLMISNEYLDLLEIGLADELQVDQRESRYPRFFAAMLMEANKIGSAKWVRSMGRDDLVEEISHAADDVFNLMQLWAKANGKP
jgi:AcrR family transcriptional regulator